MLPSRSSYPKEQLEDFYKDTADFLTLAQLLQSLDFFVTFDNKEFIIPCKVQGTTMMNPSFSNIRSIFCVDTKSMLSPTVFPIVQARVMKVMGSRDNQPIMTEGSMQFMDREIALVQEGQKEGQVAINFAVEYKEKDPEACYRDLEKITAIIVTTLYSISPGTSVRTGIYQQ